MSIHRLQSLGLHVTKVFPQTDRQAVRFERTYYKSVPTKRQAHTLQRPIVNITKVFTCLDWKID